MAADAATVPIAAQCLGCGYALRGLTASRCPECGQRFDVADPTTVWLPATLRPPKPPRPLRHPAAAVGVITLGLTLVGSARNIDPALMLAWLYWAGLATTLLVWWAFRRLASTPAARRSRRVAVACLALALAGQTTWGSCPHAAWFVLGPLAVTHSPHGRCGNPNGCPTCSVPLGGGWYLF